MATPMTASQIVAQLKKWKIKYVEVREWKTHNRNHKGPWGPVNGFIWHHTGADTSNAAAYAAGTLYDGWSALPGPLCHFGLAPDGTVYLIGWGRANHAGGGDPVVLEKVRSENYTGQLRPTKGNSNGVDGNAHFYGVEIMYSGSHKMTDAQYQTALKLSAAICDFHGWTEKSCIAHGEWSSDKWDPGYASGKTMDMVDVRADIKAVQAKGPVTTTPPPITTVTPKSRETAATLAVQVAAALVAWPFILEIEKRHALPTGLLLAVGSRETNLRNVIGDGGHGFGVFQRDNRYWPVDATYLDDVNKQAEDAATLLVANYKALGTWDCAVAAYNAGATSVKTAVAAGKSPDSVTTGGDYAADVLGRRLLIATALPKPPPPKEVDVPDKKDATYKSVWDLDAATPPKGRETEENPTWAPMSILRGIYEKVEAMEKEIAALKAKLGA